MKKLISISKAVFIVVVIVGLSGCSKDNLELLSDTVWDFKNFTTTSSNEDIQAIVALGKAIMTDGTLELNGGGSYTMDSPVIDAETGTWDLIGSNQLNFTSEGVLRLATIEELTKSKLVYFETYVWDSESYNVKYTWEK